MNLSEKRLFREIEPFFSKYGIIVTKWENCRRHRKVWITDGSKTALIIVSISPSDHRAYHNIAKSARNALREAR